MAAPSATSSRTLAAIEAAEPVAPPPEFQVEAAPAPVTLEFTLPPEATGRIARLPVVQAHRAGRSRSAPTDIVWFDTVDAALAAEGLVVQAPRRGPRVLLRSLPSSDSAWHPGQPPEVVATLAAGEAPPQAIGVPLVAIAAFTGRRQTLQLDLPDGTVILEVLAGRLRSVAAESPAARLSLAGPLDAVLAAAHALAAHLPLLTPLAGLAEEGRALATATAVRANRLGPPDTSAATTAEDAFLRAAGHLLEVVRQQTARIRHDGGLEAVHQTRVALRRLRSLLRVFRAATDGPSLRGLDARLREAVAVLGPARDWDVFLAGIGRDIDAAFPGEPRIAALIHAGEARRRAAYDAVLAMLAAPAWRALLLDALGLLLARAWRAEVGEEMRAALDQPVRDFGRAILERRWSRLRRDGAEFETLSAEHLHELRLDGKRLRYAAEVFAPVFGARAARRFLRRLAALQDGLGIANDAAVARGLVQPLAGPGTARAWAVGVVEGWCEARVVGHRGDAFAAWQRLGRKDRFWTDD
jgi:CHAD domain-containing protein